MKAHFDFLEIDGQRLETAWYGPAPEQAPTLVFLHEGLGCVSTWGDFPFELAEATDCGCFVYSRLGYGGSDTCPLPRKITFMHDEGLRALPKVIEAASIKDCVLVGHSDGASIAMIYAGGTEAKATRGLIAIAPHVFCEELTIRSIIAAKEAYQNGNLRTKLERYHGANTDCAFRGWNDVWLNPAFSEWNIEEFITRIHVPMLVIQGENDEYGTQAQVDVIRQQTRQPVQVAMIADCGHSPHREQKSQVLDLMAGFVNIINKGKHARF